MGRGHGADEGRCSELVITDLTMPEMNGLELVTSVRRHYPGVPVILMTAYGSEALSIEAARKERQATCPNPLADKLPDTVKEVSRWPRADRCHAKLIRCLDRAFYVHSRQRSGPGRSACRSDQQMVSGMELVDFTGRLQVGVAIRRPSSMRSSTATSRLRRSRSRRLSTG